MSRSLPPGAILDDEEGPQLWSAQPMQAAAAATHSSASAAAMDDEADADADADEADSADQEADEDGDVIADPYFGDADGMVGEEEATEEPWIGATAAAAADAANADAAEAVDAAAGAEESKEYAADEMGDGEEEEAVEVDEEHVPQVGDLTAAFFSEMSQSQQQGGSASKRAKHSATADGNESDEDYGVVQSRAFAIPSHLLRNFDPQSTAEPQSAEEYLLRVRLEAQKCPRVKTAKHIDPKTFVHRQTAYMPALGLVPRPANPLCLPSEEWQNAYGNEFAQARQQLVCYAANHSHVRKYTQQGTPHKRDYAAWTTWCVGNVQQQIAAAAESTAAAGAAAAAASASPSAAANSAAAASSAASSLLLPHCPSLPLVIAMDQLQTKGILQSLLDLGSDLINKRKRESEQHAARSAVAAASPDAPPIAPMPPFPFPSHAYTLWLYTLLLKVDKPIASPLASSMRAAYRALSWIRAHENRPEGDTVKFANMMTTILDKSFGQRVEFAE